MKPLDHELDVIQGSLQSVARSLELERIRFDLSFEPLRIAHLTEPMLVTLADYMEDRARCHDVFWSRLDSHFRNYPLPQPFAMARADAIKLYVDAGTPNMLFHSPPEVFGQIAAVGHQVRAIGAHRNAWWGPDACLDHVLVLYAYCLGKRIDHPGPGRHLELGTVPVVSGSERHEYALHVQNAPPRPHRVSALGDPLYAIPITVPGKLFGVSLAPKTVVVEFDEDFRPRLDVESLLLARGSQHTLPMRKKP